MPFFCLSNKNSLMFTICYILGTQITESVSLMVGDERNKSTTLFNKIHMEGTVEYRGGKCSDQVLWEEMELELTSKGWMWGLRANYGEKPITGDRETYKRNWLWKEPGSSKKLDGLVGFHDRAHFGRMIKVEVKRTQILRGHAERTWTSSC